MVVSALVSHRFPIQPVLHVHVKLLVELPLLQVPPLRHGFDSHTSRSEMGTEKMVNNYSSIIHTA